jgi:hypothetical protein
VAHLGIFKRFPADMSTIGNTPTGLMRPSPYLLPWISAGFMNPGIPLNEW